MAPQRMSRSSAQDTTSRTPHPPDPQIRRWSDAIAHHAKAIPFVKGKIGVPHRFQVAWQMIAVGARKDGLYELATQSLALMSRINPQRPEIPMWSGRHLRVRLFEIGVHTRVALVAAHA